MKNTVIELENGSEYLVIDEVSYSDRLFLLLGKVVPGTEDIEEELNIYEKKDDDTIEKIENDELKTYLMDTFLSND